MDKAQRKREAKARKARAKAARKAKNQARREAEAASSGGTDKARSSSRSERCEAGYGPPAPDAGETTPPVGAGTASAGKDARITSDVRATATPAQLETEVEDELELLDTAILADVELSQTRENVKEATHELLRGRRITDQRALEMLEDAAEAVHEVLLMVRDTLRGVSPERREAARAVLNEKPQSGGDGRKLPRRAPDPVVTLERLNMQAASLLKRILAKTNPGVGKKKAA